MSLTDDFKSRFPEFAEAVVDKYLPILGDVWPCYYPQPYKKCNKEIILNLIAHLITLEQSPGTSSVREQASRSVGKVSVSFVAKSSQGDLGDFFGASKYGQRFMLLASTPRRAYFV